MLKLHRLFSFGFLVVYAKLVISYNIQYSQAERYITEVYVCRYIVRVFLLDSSSKS